MRLFIGSFAKINEYDKIKEKFDPFFDGKWIDKKNLHITYKFLGNIDDVNKIISNLKNIVYPKNEIIKFGSFELFNNKIFFASSNNDILYDVNSKIDQRLQNIYPDSKKFIPHITLMRIKKIKDDNYTYMLNKQSEDIFIKLKVSLIKSESGQYSTVEEF